MSELGMNEDPHLTLASALLSSRNLTICWWPVLVQWNRAVQPRQSFCSNSAPCFRGGWEPLEPENKTHSMTDVKQVLCGALLHLQQEVRDALVATARRQHQRAQPLGRGRVDVHTSLQQEIRNVVVADVGGVHQRGPSPDVLPVQVHLTPETVIRWNSFSVALWKTRKERHLLFDALGHHVVLADGAGGVEVQRDIELLGPHQGVAEPHGEAGTQLLRFAGFVTQLRHLFFFNALREQGTRVYDDLVMKTYVKYSRVDLYPVHAD